MTISILFFIFLAAFVLSTIAAFINFFLMSRNMFNSVNNKDMMDGFEQMGKKIGWHILFGGLAALSALGSLVTGVIWLVIVLSA